MKMIFFGFLLVNFAVLAQEDSLAYKKAQAELENGNANAALKSIDKALSLAQKEDYFLLKSEILTGLENYQGVYDTYQSGLGMFPESFNIHNSLGVFLTEIGEIEYATEILSKTIDLAGSDSNMLSTAYTNRSGVYTAVRDFESSYDDLIKAHNLDATNIAPLINLGAICDDIGKAEEGIQFLYKALEIDPTYYPIYGNIGFIHQNKGDYAKAIECYNKVLEMNPDEPLGYSNRSFNRMKLGDYKEAMNDIDKSIKLYPQNSYAYMVKGSIYVELKRYEKACEQFSIALQKGFTERYGRDVETMMAKYCQ
jgi:tetratricopeptide (TPR) repeat protein